MEPKQIDKCLKKYGYYPMTIILKRLEEKERYEDCACIYKGIMTRIDNDEDIPKDHDRTILTNMTYFEQQYYAYFQPLYCKGEGYVKEHVKEVLKEELTDINSILKLNLKIK